MQIATMPMSFHGDEASTNAGASNRNSETSGRRVYHQEHQVHEAESW